jgi:hypothetical protein
VAQGRGDHGQSLANQILGALVLLRSPLPDLI